MSSTDINERVKLKLIRLVMQYRRQQKAGDFIRLNKNSIRLFGKQAAVILSSTDKKKLHEIIPVEDEMSVERYSGESVTLSDVFLSSENAIWDGDTIMFMTEDGVLVSVNQYEYIQKHGPLSQYYYFAKSNNSIFLCLSSLARILFTFTVSAIIVKRGLSFEFDASAIWHCIMGEVTLTAGFVAVASVIVHVTVPRVRCYARQGHRL